MYTINSVQKMPRMVHRLFQLIIFSLVITKCRVKTELFTALVEMEDLLETESVLIKTLERYIKMQDNKLAIFKTKILPYMVGHNAANSDIRAYISNPINSFLLIKRLTTDWKEIEVLMSIDVGGEFLDNVTNYRSILKFPTDEDLNGAAVALTRLQDTYNLETSSVARGELNGIQYNTRMSATDCFELGRQTYLNADYYHTELWMREAMQHLTEEQNHTLIYKPVILEYLAFSTFKQGNLGLALEMTNELLELRPDHEDAIANKVYYEQLLRRNNGLKRTVSFSYETHERLVYEMMCRDDIQRPKSKLANLHCRYVTNKSPFLKIAPLKLEEAHLDPYIVVYHEIIYDREIDVITKLAKPKLKRASVHNDVPGEKDVSNIRIAKFARLNDDDHRYIRNVALRVEDMTGLTTDTAEPLHVVNYGIGGHYEPHFDFAHKDDANAYKSLGARNRIATVLFYMSDVQQGGATVFPAIKMVLRPKKGTAAFWMNLYKSGEGNYLMRHAACPVLMGSKWISTKWLHEAGQEWNRPCDLQPDNPTSE